MATETATHDDQGDLLHLVKPTEMAWQPALSGCSVKTLFFDATTGMVTALMKFEPGPVVPDHEHVGIEQTRVMEGAPARSARIRGVG